MKEEDEVIEKEPADEKVEKSKGWNWGMVVVVVFVVIALAGLSAPMILRCPKASERTWAISNAKQVGLALLEFDQEYGSFPDETTKAKVMKSTGTDLDLSGHSSNAMFRQLIAFGVQSEDIFFAPKHPECRKKPDNNISPGKALEAGEVGWSYMMLAGGVGQNTSGNPGRPVLAAPMKIGTEQFWPDAFGDKGVILRLDNSVEAPLIRSKDLKVSVGNGRTLFETGPESVWGDVGAIDIRHPEPGK
jgi:hypothetical protein